MKYVRMGASSNFGNIFSVLSASIFVPFLPMTPLQILTNNLLYDVSQTAIPTDDVDAGLLGLTLVCYVALTQMVKVRLVRRGII